MSHPRRRRNRRVRRRGPRRSRWSPAPARPPRSRSRPRPQPGPVRMQATASSGTARPPRSRSRSPSRYRRGSSPRGRATTVPVRWRSRQHGSRVRVTHSPPVAHLPETWPNLHPGALRPSSGRALWPEFPPAGNLAVDSPRNRRLRPSDPSGAGQIRPNVPCMGIWPRTAAGVASETINPAKAVSRETRPQSDFVAWRATLGGTPLGASTARNRGLRDHSAPIQRQGSASLARRGWPLEADRDSAGASHALG